jgi:hypothetical protein
MGDYVAWRRADYFAQHLLGESDASVDMWELNREKQDKPVAAPATVTGAGRGGGRGRGGN